MFTVIIVVGICNIDMLHIYITPLRQAAVCEASEDEASDVGIVLLFV